MSSPRDKYWFPAKKYGWGWGLPTRWQGWLVFVLYLGLFTFGAFFFREQAYATTFIVFVAIITLALLFICWKKGEPPRWRWGGD